MKQQPRQQAHNLNDLHGLTYLGQAACSTCYMTYGHFHVADLKNDAIQCGEQVFVNKGICPYCGGRLTFERKEA